MSVIKNLSFPFALRQMNIHRESYISCVVALGVFNDTKAAF